jgi:hypothetical protein
MATPEAATSTDKTREIVKPAANAGSAVPTSGLKEPTEIDTLRKQLADNSTKIDKLTKAFEEEHKENVAEHKENHDLKVNGVVKEDVKEIYRLVEKWTTEADKKEIARILTEDFKSFSPEDKEAFKSALATKAGMPLEKYLTYNFSQQEIADIMLDFYSGPKDIAKRGEVIANFVDQAGTATGLISQYLKDRTPEELQAINKAYAATHGIDLFTKIKGSTYDSNPENDNRIKEELVGSLEGSREGKDAAALYFASVGKDEAGVVSGVLANYKTPAEMKILETKFKSMFASDPEAQLGLERFLERKVDSAQDVSTVVAKFDGVKSEEVKGIAAEKAASEKKAADEKAIAAAKFLAEASEKAKKDAQAEAAKGIETDQGKLKLALSQEALNSGTPLMKIVSDYEKARTSGDIDAMERVKTTLMHLKPEEKKAFIDKASSWNPENKPTGQYSAEDLEEIYAHRRELQTDIIRVLKKPEEINSASFTLTRKGLDKESYAKLMAESKLA